MPNLKPAALLVALLIAHPATGQSTAPAIQSPNPDHQQLLLAVQSRVAEEAKLTASDASGGNNLGFSVSLDGDRALVGAPFASTPSGEAVGVAYVFVRNGTTWTEEAKLTASVPHGDKNQGNFGRSVSLLGARALVGAPVDEVATGAAYVFVRSGSAWTEEARLIANDRLQFDFFGSSVSLDGDRALVGARAGHSATQSNVGAAYFFLRSGTAWSEEAKIIASDPRVNGGFGTAVSLDGAVALIGANGAALPPLNAVGAGYFFERSSNTWTEVAQVYASDAATSMEFGGAVSLDGTRALIGSKAASGSRGAAYIFARSGSTWAEEAKLTASDGDTNDLFGASVSLADDQALIGANNKGTTAGAGAGAAYVFARSGSSWTESEILTASDADGSEQFGVSVALNGGRALVGARIEDLPGAGNAGAAYVFGVTPVSIENDVPTATNRLEPPFPNPGRGSATVRFTLEESGSVELALFDVRGRIVAASAVGVRGRGTHEQLVDYTHLPAGVYFLRLLAGSRPSTQRLLVID